MFKVSKTKTNRNSRNHFSNFLWPQVVFFFSGTRTPRSFVDWRFFRSHNDNVNVNVNVTINVNAKKEVITTVVRIVCQKRQRASAGERQNGRA